VKFFNGKVRDKKMQSNVKEFKTGYSTTLTISSMQKIVEYAYKLKMPKAEVGRKIIEYFIEHNDVEDLKE
jgi:molybdopterin synthase catalytic subunit